MTCIVGIVDKKNKTVILGADSAAISGIDIVVRKDPKIFRIGEFVIGCTSSFRMIQLLMFSLRLPEVKPKQDVYKYMCTDFINAVRECFREGGFLMKTGDGDEMGGTFLVGYRDRLFKVCNDFQVAEPAKGIDACGCGADYALGAIFAMRYSEMSVESKVNRALLAAATFSAGVCKPFNIERTN